MHSSEIWLRWLLGNIAEMLLPTLLIFPVVYLSLQSLFSWKLASGRQLLAFLGGLTLAALASVLFGAAIADWNLTKYLISPFVASTIAIAIVYRFDAPSRAVMTKARDGTSQPEHDEISDDPKNIRVFNFLVLKLFCDLYERFPVRLDISAVAYATTLSPDGLKSTDYEGRIEILSNAIHWLIREGLLRCERATESDEFYGLELTSNAFVAFGSLPDSIASAKPQEPIIAKAKRICESGLENASSELLKQLIASIIKLAKQIGNSGSA